MLYEQRLLWMTLPSDVVHQINDARKYVELKQDILDSAQTEIDIRDSQFVLGIAVQTYRKLVENKRMLKEHLYQTQNIERKLA
jgi:hypothetical protein